MQVEVSILPRTATARGVLGLTAVELRMKSLSGRQSLALALTRNLTLPKELESKTKSKSKSKRQATVLNSTAVHPNPLPWGEGEPSATRENDRELWIGPK